MQLRSRPALKGAIKSQSISVTLPDGRVIGICSEDQMKELMDGFRQRLRTEAAYAGKQLTGEEVDAAADKWQQECGFATLKSVLGMMTPAQRQKWRDQYRFGGVSRRWG